MPTIHLTTFIEAPIERVFDLSRSITIYKSVFNGRKESFTSGASGNLLVQGDTITIHAKHFGKLRTVTLKATALNKPATFTSEQVKGDLIRFKHEQHFKQTNNGTLIIDLVDFDKPRDFIGGIIAKFYLKKYLLTIIEAKNALAKAYAESEKWKAVLS
jgi:ligand-binding SRPBCC domain-containing protein